MFKDRVMIELLKGYVESVKRVWKLDDILSQYNINICDEGNPLIFSVEKVIKEYAKFHECEDFIFDILFDFADVGCTEFTDENGVTTIYDNIEDLYDYLNSL